MSKVLYNVWAYIEPVANEGTDNEHYIENLVGPVKLMQADTLALAMMDMWASTSDDAYKVTVESIIEAAERIKQEMAEGKYKWTKRESVT